MLTPIALSHELRTLVRGAISVNRMLVRHLEVPNVVVRWIFCSAEFEQACTVRDAQALVNRLARIRIQTIHRFEEQTGHSAIAIT